MVEVVRFYGDDCNDYEQYANNDEEEAREVLAILGYSYSTTYGTEMVFCDNAGHIASITPVDA